MIKTKDDLINHFGGYKQLEDFLIYYIRPISELRQGFILKNISINDVKVGEFITITGSYKIRIYYSGDNYPESQMIYSDNITHSISNIIIHYRDYKLNQILCIT